MGFLFGGSKSSKDEANAITDTAKAQAAADREAARGAELTAETLLSQDKASKAAAELLAKPPEKVQVDLAGVDDYDHRATRESYSKNTPLGSAPTPLPGGGVVSPPRQRGPRPRVPRAPVVIGGPKQRPPVGRKPVGPIVKATTPNQAGRKPASFVLPSAAPLKV